MFVYKQKFGKKFKQCFDYCSTSIKNRDFKKNVERKL